MTHIHGVINNTATLYYDQLIAQLRLRSLLCAYQVELGLAKLGAMNVFHVMPASALTCAL